MQQSLAIAHIRANVNIDIAKSRPAMWEKVAKRLHKPVQIYAFSAGSDDCMLHGSVDYVLKDGKSTLTSWGAKAHFAKEDGELKMDFYQVFLVGISNDCQDGTNLADHVTGYWCNG